MIQALDRLADWLEFRRGPRWPGGRLGFVPTMGALHEGHASLVRRARAENDHVLVSIFVNPTQFDQAQDLAAYPRTRERDLALLEAAGADTVIFPQAAEIYPDDYRYRVTESKLSLELEGAHRPGHFDGVLTVVLKLLQIAGADRAYFGEKDYQQLKLVQGMAKAFFLNTCIVACPLVRDADGLALSSRNVRLNSEQRKLAQVFPQTLATRSTAQEAESELKRAGLEVDYVVDRDGKRLGAVRVGSVRLIDALDLPPAGGAA